MYIHGYVHDVDSKKETRSTWILNLIESPKVSALRFKIYFPSQDKDGNSTDFSETMMKIQQKLIQDFGGFTMYEATGYWKGKEIVVERVLIFEVYTDEVTETYLRVLASTIKTELNQASVMFTINNEAYFV